MAPASDEELLLLMLLIKKKRRRSRTRKIWIHPMLSSRMEKGLYYTLFDDLCANEEKFFNYFRMSLPSFQELLTYIRNDINGTDNLFRPCIPPEEKLVITLRYLATGTSMTDLQYQYRVGLSTISGIIREVCNAIWRRVKPICFPTLTERFWLDTAAEFFEKTNFPHCIGAIDGKHIRIIKPEASGSLYYNYKNYFSILLIAVCDASYKFIYVDVGSYGKSADSTVLKESKFYRGINDGSLNIPSPKTSFTGFSEAMPFVFVGDEGFGLTNNILRPYSGKCISVKKRIFNYRLCRARRNIECSFGILANKWRILHRPLNVELSLCEDIVKTCCVLHNFVRERDGYRVEDILSANGLYDLDLSTSQQEKKATKLRDKFADYFLTDEGSVPWQMERI